MGHPADRQARPNGRSMGVFRVADGKIAEHWGSPDLLGPAHADRRDAVTRRRGRPAPRRRHRRRQGRGSDRPRGAASGSFAATSRMSLNRRDLAMLDDIRRRRATSIIAPLARRIKGLERLQEPPSSRGVPRRLSRRDANTIEEHDRRGRPRRHAHGSATGTHIGPFMGMPADRQGGPAHRASTF